MKMTNIFERCSDVISRYAGAGPAFLGALLVIIVWACTGPFFGFSDTWQLVINTGTTIITFLMVFLIQNTTNRQTAKMEDKANSDFEIDSKAEKILEELIEIQREQVEHINSVREQHQTITDAIIATNKSIQLIAEALSEAARED